MNTRPALDDLFEHRITYPDSTAKERLDRLVGLDDHKGRLTKILALLVNPAGLEAWAQEISPKRRWASEHRAQASAARRPRRRRRRREIRACRIGRRCRRQTGEDRYHVISA